MASACYLFWWDARMHRHTHIYRLGQKTLKNWDCMMGIERSDGKKTGRGEERCRQHHHSFILFFGFGKSESTVCVFPKRRQSQSVKTPPPNSKRQYGICIFPTIQLTRLSASPLRSHASSVGHLSLTHIQTCSHRPISFMNRCIYS